MSDKKAYDPYESFHKLSVLWEKQINDCLFLWTNNNEFVKMAGFGTEVHSRFLEAFKKNQVTLAKVLNLPTKNDVMNVANLTIQTEEKIETLEEQLWELQDSVKSQSKDIESVVEVSQEIIKLTKQLKTELVKSKKDLAETKNLHEELKEMKFELMKLNDFKEEIETLKHLIKADKAEEPVFTAAASAK